MTPRLLPLIGLLLLAGCLTPVEPYEIAVASGFNVVRHEPGAREDAIPVAGVRLGAPGEVEATPGGEVLVLNFWGSWCGPCRREQPHLEALWREYGPRGVRFVGVNTRRDQEAAALAFLAEFDVTYPSIYDPTSGIAYDWGVRFMPMTFVIDREGKVAATIVGALRRRADLASILDDVIR